MKTTRFTGNRAKTVFLGLAGFIFLVAMTTAPARGDFIDLPVKWSQPITVGSVPHKGPDPVPAASVIDGADHLSNHLLNVVRADDFISDGRPIVAVRWWGSYLDTADMGVVRPNGFTGPFDISFHLSDANFLPGVHPFSLPDALLALSTVTAQEFFVGFDSTGHAVYRYDAFIPVFEEQKGVEYFLDIDKPNPNERWGWHDTHLQFLDYSAVAPTHAGPWSSTGSPPPNGVPGFDLAFELLTIPEPATSVMAVFTLPWLLYRRR